MRKHVKRHGGKRAGAGRPQVDPAGPKTPVTIWITPTEREYLKRLSGIADKKGAAEGLRRILARHIDM